METAQAIENLHDLSIDRVENRPTVRAFRLVHLYCPRGRVEASYYPAQPSPRAVVLVGGLGERQESPAANLFAHLGEVVAHRRTAALRLRARHPDSAEETRYDLALALRFLLGERRTHFAVIAYGDAGPAAVQVALADERITALALLAALPATGDVSALSPRCRLLAVHGGRDEVSPLADARRFYDRFGDPKELLVLPRTTHTLNENSTEVQLRLRDWLAGWGS